MIRTTKYYNHPARRNEIFAILLLANLIHAAKKKGHGGPHGVPAPPPVNPPPPVDPGPTDPPPGGSSDLNFGSIGKYNPVGHPFTDRVVNATLPDTYLHTEYGFDTSGASIGAFVDVILVNTGDRATNTALVQSAIDTNRLLNQNTRILLPSVFPMFSFDCKELTFAGKWIYIQRSTEPCVAGLRANPINMASAPECTVAYTEDTAIRFNRKASRYYIMGLRFVMNPLISHAYWLVPMFPREGSDDLRFVSTDVNDEIILDRCLVQGNDTGTGLFNGNIRVGIFCDGKRHAIVNSYIHQCSSISGEETKGILITQNQVATKVVNNYIEAGSECSIIGGERPKWGPSFRTTNVEWRRNDMARRLTWCNTDPSWDGQGPRTVKNVFEVKNVDKLLFEGNVIHSNWADGQAGMIIVIKSAGDGTPGTGGIGCQTTNATFRYNKIFGSVRCYAINGFPDEDGATKATRIALYDNLAYEIGTYGGQTSGIAWTLTQAIDDLYIRHNTLIHNEFTQGNFQFSYQQATRSQRFTFSDNITSTGAASDAAPGGLVADGAKYGYEAVNSWAENAYFERNLLIGPYDPLIVTLNTFGTNVTVANVAAMNFLNAPAHNYRLTASSPGKGAGFGGRDLGADIDKVDLATSGVV